MPVNLMTNLRRVARGVVHRTKQALRGPSEVVAQCYQREANKSNPDIIHVWVPKTAGTSLNKLLTRAGGQTLLSVGDVRKYFRDRGLVTFGHMSLPDLLREGLVSEAYFARAWKFAFVRNPFDRAVSLYEYLRGDMTLPQTTTFRVFCHYLEERAFPPVRLVNREGLNQLNPQTAWLRDSEGRLFPDFIGRFETFEADMETVFAKINISQRARRVSRANVSKRQSLAAYYGTWEIGVVCDIYQDDFVSLGYSTDPYWLTAAPPG